MKVVVVASLAFSLVNFRGALLAAMAAAGHEVIACAPEDDADVRAALARMGVRYERIPMERASLDPKADVATLSALVRLLRAERPDILLAYTQKPIVYGGLASRIVKGSRFYAMVSGLGYVFTESGSRRRRLLRFLVSRLYGFAIHHARAVFVFNRDDKAEMLRRHIVRPDHTVIQVPGSGVDLAHYPHQPVPEGPPVFLLIARLLRDKGLGEYAEAARLVRARYPDCRFRLLGPVDPNPSGISPSELNAWRDEGVIDYLGETRDVRPHLQRSSVFVLPSWYREGLPRTILEALATGRAIITTDAPGCRETVIAGENGFLVPVRDAGAVAEAAMRFAEDPALAVRMGERSRALAEAHFSVERVNGLLLAAMGLAESSVPNLPMAGRESPRSSIRLAGEPG
jgi:glycosyltransferase involved in cell wall biosynthesis